MGKSRTSRKGRTRHTRHTRCTRHTGHTGRHRKLPRTKRRRRTRRTSLKRGGMLSENKIQEELDARKAKLLAATAKREKAAADKAAKEAKAAADAAANAAGEKARDIFLHTDKPVKIPNCEIPGCKKAFGWTTWKYNCYICGKRACAKCTQKTLDVSNNDRPISHRDVHPAPWSMKSASVCNECFLHREEEDAKAKQQTAAADNIEQQTKAQPETEVEHFRELQRGEKAAVETAAAEQAAAEKAAEIASRKIGRKAWSLNLPGHESGRGPERLITE